MHTLPEIGELVATSRCEVDLANADAVRDFVRAVCPDVIINAAAYTAVDRAEAEEALAAVVNTDGPRILATEAARSGALLVHFSTDYVFDGEKRSPYNETDVTVPLNAYGRTKLRGEKAVEGAGCRYLTFRTSWVYGSVGRNFLSTMLRLAREGKPLKIVDDQTGAPTSNFMIATAMGQILRHALSDASISGTFHMSAQGSTTWYGFACAIFRQLGIDADVRPIPSSQYAMPARRPRNSMLDNTKLERVFGVRLPLWDTGMRQVLATLS
jgi:dTDP-4-dehydrorhamnose reductase